MVVIKYSDSFKVNKNENNFVNIKNGFYKPGDLEEETKDKYVENATLDDINNYLVEIVSGKKYDSFSELGTLTAEGNIIVSFVKLRKMVDEGYNIYYAKAFNEDMIEIKFQKFTYDKELMERRRR